MDYNMDGHTLLSVNHHPYLGIELSKDINWATHINQVANKANKILGLLKRNLNACSTTVKEKAYKSLVRPKLEYCGAILWDPYENNNKSTIEKVQCRAARFVLNDYKRKSSVNDMLTVLGWETLELRRIRLRLITIYKSNLISKLLREQNSTKRGKILARLLLPNQVLINSATNTHCIQGQYENGTCCHLSSALPQT